MKNGLIICSIRWKTEHPQSPSPWKKVSQPASMPSSFKDLMREAEEKRKKEMLSGAL